MGELKWLDVYEVDISSGGKATQTSFQLSSSLSIKTFHWGLAYT